MNFLRKLFGAKPAPVPPPTAAAPASSAPLPPPTAPAPALPPPTITPTFPERPAPAPLRLDQIETTLLTLDGPVWLPPDSPANELLPAKSDEASVVAFLGGSAEIAPGQSPEEPGRLARALPLFLADQVEFGTDALSRTHVAWMIKPRPGFILGGKNWDDATASRHVRGAAADDPADYVVISHLLCPGDFWTIELRLVRTIDANCLATFAVDCPANDPAQALAALSRELLVHLAAHADIAAAASSPDFATTPDAIPMLDQLLAVRFAALPGAADTLRGEREILERQIQLCREQPANLPARFILVHTLAGLKKIRPAILPEFQARMEALQNEHPLPEPAHAIASRILAETFSV